MSSYDPLPVRQLPSGRVLAGYEPGEFYDYDSLCAPYQPQQSGESYQERLTQVNPAVGNEWRHICPGSFVEEVLTIRYKFATSAVVANRVPMLVIIDQNGSEVWRTPPSSNQAAGQTSLYAYSSATGASQPFLSNSVALAMTRIFLFPQWQIGTTTAALDVGDQYSEIALVVNRWNNRPRRVAAVH